MPIVYNLDTSGVNPSNLVSGELHTVNEAKFGDYYFIVPNFAPFYIDNFSATITVNGVTTTLVENVDFSFALEYVVGTRVTGKVLYGGITLHNLALNGVITLNYQTIGGDQLADRTQVLSILAEKAYNPRTTIWDLLINLPTAFPPVPHYQDYDQFFGQTEVVTKLGEIRDALLQSSTSVQTQISNVLNGMGFGNASGGGGGQTAVGNYVSKTGDTMTGPLSITVQPVSPNHAVTVSYVDQIVNQINNNIANNNSNNNYVKKAGDIVNGPIIQNSTDFTNVKSLINVEYLNSRLTSTSASPGDIVIKPKLGNTLQDVISSETNINYNFYNGYLRCNGSFVSKITYSQLYNAIGDHFTYITETGNGRPWEQQYNIDLVSTSNIGITNLPNPYTYTGGSLNVDICDIFFVKNVGYLITNPDALGNNLFTISIDQFGNMTIAPHPIKLPFSYYLATSKTIASKAIVARNKVYLFNKIGKGRVYTLDISPTDGSISNLVQTNELNILSNDANNPDLFLTQCEYVITKNIIIAVCLYNQNNNLGIYYRDITGDTNWKFSGIRIIDSGLSVNAINFNDRSFRLAVVKDKLYIFATSYGASNVNFSKYFNNKIYVLDIDNLGYVHNLRQIERIFPKKLQNIAIHVVRNAIYIVGTEYDINTNTTNLSSIAIKVMPNGDLGDIIHYGDIIPNIGNTKTNVELFRYDYDLYVFVSDIYYDTTPVGIYINSFGYDCQSLDLTPYCGVNPLYDLGNGKLDITQKGNGRPWSLMYNISTMNPLPINNVWNTSPIRLPVGLSSFCTVCTKNKIYLIGGNTNIATAVNTIYEINVNPIQGDIISISLSPITLPDNNVDGSVVTIGNKVYLIGGFINGGPNVNNVAVANIDANGNIGTWSFTTSLPANLFGLDSLVYNGKIYVFGGCDNPVNPGIWYDTIYSINIDANGNIVGNWQIENAVIDKTIAHFQAFAIKDKIYLLNGENDGSLNDVEQINIRSDGSLDNSNVYSYNTSGLTPTSNGRVLVFNNYVLYFGGSDFTTINMCLQYTTISPEGDLGNIVEIPLYLPIANTKFGLAQVGNFTYIIGGVSVELLNYDTIQYSNLFGTNTTDFSSYYNGTIPSFVNTDYFRLPDLTYKEGNGLYYYIKT